MKPSVLFPSLRVFLIIQNEYTNLVSFTTYIGLLGQVVKMILAMLKIDHITGTTHNINLSMIKDLEIIGALHGYRVE